MRVIGTAGHVDHGKSTLVTALTGINPDRLKEEQEREMTIDLGFAWMALPDGEPVGIIDVPGHRDFIENMLAGVGGIDAVLFVVAADEGVMPQTREHLTILDILQVQGGVIALTKCDLVTDPEWLDLVKNDVRQVVQGTILADAPLVQVSAVIGSGINELRIALGEVLAKRPLRSDLGRPRLPVDRVFTMPGFGTVVTGTLVDGSFRIGDEVETLPEGLRGRVRGLQSHQHAEDSAAPGSRTAMNISGLKHEQVKRGDVIAHPGVYKPTNWLDVTFRLVADATGPLKHNTECKLFIGAAEVQARIRLLGTEELTPGQKGWLQLELRQPVIAMRGDHYLLRRPSPGETLGGGIVVDPQPDGRHKRFDADILKQLDTLAQGSPSELLLRASLVAGPLALHDLVARSRLPTGQVAGALAELLASGELSPLENGSLSPESEVLVIARAHWENLLALTEKEMQEYHCLFPLRPGIPREELKSKLKLSGRTFNAFIKKASQEGRLVDAFKVIVLPGHAVRFSPPQQARVNALLARFTAAPYAPPSVKDCQAEVGEEIFNALISLGQLEQVSAEVVFQRQDFDALLAGVRGQLEKEGTLTVAQFRDRFNTSRRYALAFLEHLDAIGVTQRDGDLRRLK